MIKTIAVIGADGTIGRSLFALFLRDLSLPFHFFAFDTKSDAEETIIAYLTEVLPSPQHNRIFDNLAISTSVADAVAKADIVYEVGPEQFEFKSSL